MPKIATDHPAGEALRRLMRKTMKGVASDLEAARNGKTVHPARRRLKLARSLLRLLKPALGKDVFAAENGTLREAAHGLAGLRRAEAMNEAIAKLKAHSGDPEKRARLFRELEHGARTLRQDADDPREIAERTETARALIDDLRGRISGWPLPKRDVGLFVEGMRASYAKARKLLRRGLDAEDTALLHEARKSVIHHLHHIELLAPLWPKLFKAWADELRALREDLGDLNDLDELEGLLHKPNGDFAKLAHAKEACALIGLRRTAIVAKIGNETGHLFAERPNSFAARMRALWDHIGG